MKWVWGHELSPEVQRQALATYVYRYTRDHVPAWAIRDKRADGTPFPVQFASDADWLEHSRFPVTKAGRLASRPPYCYSDPTWPDGKPAIYSHPSGDQATAKVTP